MDYIRRSHFARSALIFTVAIVLGAVCASSAFAITRDQVLARAQTRIDAPVPYSQAKYYAGYRTDCSGYVSMCWATGTSWATSSFYKVSYRINTSQLTPGDALLKPGYHVRLFYAWLDPAHTRYVAYESADGKIAGCRIHSIAEDLAFGYVPTRYDKIAYSPPSRNLLKNGTFNTWAKSWGSSAEQPVWWDAEGERGQQVVQHRKNVWGTAVNSLMLLNPSADPEVSTQLSQSVPVVAAAPYLLTAKAATSFDPARVTLRIVYLNASGESVAETSTTGDRAKLIGSSLKSFSLLSTSPTSAVTAQVAVTLAGGTNATGALSGSTVTLDDISLVRPQVTVGIKSNTTTSYRGKQITLSGSVTPTSAIGVPATLYVKKPGSDWASFSTTKVIASGGGAAWSRGYSFTSSSPRGTYQFRTMIGSYPGVLGATSNPVSVTLK